MPTTRPRSFVTESDELAVALGGHCALNEQRERVVERRRAMLARAGTLLSGLGPREELERIRAEDWSA